MPDWINDFFAAHRQYFIGNAQILRKPEALEASSNISYAHV